MYFFSKICFLCLSTYKNLNLVLIESSEGILIQKQLKYCFPEIIDSHPQVPKYICSNCSSKLECFYKFRQTCLRNNTYLKSYFQTLTSTDESYKHLSVKLTDIKYRNKLQTVSSEQTLATVGSEDELRTGQKEDIGICIQEAVFKSEIQCADVLNIEDSHLLYEEKDEVVVKEEFLTLEDDINIKFYRDYIKSMNYVSSQSDFDASVSSIEDVVDENSKCSKNSSESIATNPKENKVTGKKMIKKCKKIQCAFCKKEFMYKSYLSRHESIHTGVKNHKCTICKKKFTQKFSLNQHEIIHTGVKNYECTICRKDFTRKSNLVQHESIHTGVKNYECTICKKKFAKKLYLSRHEKIHTGIKCYECLICNKKFGYKRSLDNHKYIHTGIN